MNKIDYEHRVVTKKDGKVDNSSPASEDSKYIGTIYRRAKNNLSPGESIELQRRPLGPWETVENERKETDVNMDTD